MPKPSTQSVSDKFTAFSDPTRLRILHLLRDGELCVGDLVTIVDLPQPTISRHLAYLRRAKLVETRKSGLWMYYSLAPATSEFHRRLLDCLTACFADVPELKKDAARAKKLKKTGGCCAK
jgi:ArsR family transcriptional regulator